jgi:hypothetical protein
MALTAGRPSQKLPPKTLASLRGEGEKARLNVDIPKALYRQIKQRALDEDITITELTLKAVNEYLSK